MLKPIVELSWCQVVSKLNLMASKGGLCYQIGTIVKFYTSISFGRALNKALKFIDPFSNILYDRLSKQNVSVKENLVT